MKLQFSATLVAIGPRDANDVHVLKFAGARSEADLRARTEVARDFAAYFGQTDAVRVTLEAGEPTGEIAPEAPYQAARDERAAIIAWLRETSKHPCHGPVSADALLIAAGDIESGRHRKGST